MALSRLKTKGRKEAPRGFAGIPRHVMDNPDYINLTGNAVKLLNALSYQFRGKNNGDLTAAWGYMKRHGFNSQATLHRATKELVDARLILKTREGMFLKPGGRCALYALTWLPIHECPGKDLEVKPTITPPRKFSIETTLGNEKPSSKSEQTNAAIATESESTNEVES